MTALGGWELWPMAVGGHVVPRNDLREHDAAQSCWCSPAPDDEDSNLILHNAADQRELWEEGRNLQ